MLRDFAVPLVARDITCALDEAKRPFGHACHDRLLALAQRAIAHQPSIAFAFDPELHRGNGTSLTEPVRLA